MGKQILDKTKKDQTTKNQHLKKKRLSKRFNRLKITAKDKQYRGVLYVAHLPKGFNEKELKAFFNQFGEVSKIRVSRSTKVIQWCV